MKKNLLRRLGCGILAMAMLLLSACGNSSTSSNPTANEGTSGNATQNISEIEMPTADLSNNSKVLKVFGWSPMSENNTDGEAAEYFKKEFGVTIEETVSTHTTYWSDLAKMVSAGNAPDVVDCSYDKFWPVPVSEDLLEPWDIELE